MTQPATVRKTQGHYWARTNVAALALILSALWACSPAPEPPKLPKSTTATLSVSGTVVEQLDGPPYSYLRLRTGEGEAWVVVPIVRLDERTKAKGVRVVNGVRMRNFDAAPLGRRFDQVVFGTLQ